MRFAIEFSADAERDFDLIFDHLFESYLAFGESTEEGLDHSAQRVMDIRRAADGLASSPLRSTARD
jgi:toxin ParE1/3/4